MGELASWEITRTHPATDGIFMNRQRTRELPLLPRVVHGGWLGSVPAGQGRRDGVYLACGIGRQRAEHLSLAVFPEARRDVRRWPWTLPWFQVAVAGFLGTLLALSRIPIVARAVAAPGMASRLVRPHSFRVAGVVFLLYMAAGIARRWPRAGSRRAPAAAPPCDSTRSA